MHRFFALFIFSMLPIATLAADIPQNQRASIVWNNIAACPIDSEVTSHFTMAYNRSNDPATLEASVPLLQALDICVRREGQAYAKSTTDLFATGGAEHSIAFSDIATAAAQVALVSEGAAIRNSNSKAAYAAYHMVVALNTAMDSGTNISLRYNVVQLREFGYIYRRAREEILSIANPDS